jgi:hypothetical protein
MQAITELEYWTADVDERAGRMEAHPLALFNACECGAWIETLRALRALPRPHRARIDRAEPCAEEEAAA